ncbi:unnamed protein product [Acanthosepion pharaonis]|uniref:PKD/REJ-like domain-containing protein n=1 Tax=Acanthosepion pharaonis TaxID=158019 RepID=A0A812CG46_ACAPH|nr:unnamed protein product [Sepia pharaonis]
MPSVDSCQFGATGAEIDITFRQKIDTSKLDSCDQIFTDINSLGKGAKCIWQSLRILSIVIGQGDNLIVPGSNLTFKSGSVKVDGELYALALNGSITVTKPSKPLPIKAIITGPTRLPVCGTVLFSGTKSTGAGGRDLLYEWSLNTLVGNLSSFEVNTTELNEGKKYSLTLKVTNFMSNWITSTLEVVRESQAIPIVYITSNVDTSNVQLSDTFHLHANVILPPCVSAGVTYLWSAKANNKLLNLDPKWASLNRYRVQKNKLPGGEFRTVGVDSTQNLVLDASLSYDPDYDGTADPDLKFDWTCLQESQGQIFPCYIGTSFKNHSSKTSPLLRLAISDLQANNKYSFSVNVYKGRRKAFAKTIIEVTEGDPPEVELEPLPRGGLVIPTEPLWLRTYIRSSTPVTVEWSTLDTGKAGESFLNLNDSSNLLRPTLTVNTQQNGVHFSLIVIKPSKYNLAYVFH